MQLPKHPELPIKAICLSTKIADNVATSITPPVTFRGICKVDYKEFVTSYMPQGSPTGWQRLAWR